MEHRRPMARGPYVGNTGRKPAGVGHPSDALAANLRAYRLLRHLTQDGMAALMAQLGHGWGRSTVSAVEGKSRNVTVDVGLRDPDTGRPEPVDPALARQWASSEAVIRLGDDGALEADFPAGVQVDAIR